MKILYAVDLTESRLTTGAVESIAERMSADLLVLHVFAPTSTAPMPIDPMSGFGDFAYVTYDPEVQHNIERAEEHEFHAFLVAHFVHPIQPEILNGDPATCILEQADEQGADLIVLGKRHHNRLERILLGSVTREVFERADRPVLLMPRREDADVQNGLNS